MNRFALLAALTVALFAFSTPAFADDHRGSCGDPPCGQGGGQGPGGQGGGGGQGGSGGEGGPGGAGGTGGDAFAAQGQLQGQLQGQAQGQAQGVFDSGNSASRSSSSATGGNAAQGQQQGLVGIQGQLGILDNENNLDNSTAVSTSTSNSSKNKQDQTAVGSVDSHDSITVEGDDIVYEAPDIPVNSAAPVFAGACSQGVSIQTQSFGGSAGTTNSVCDYVAVAGGFIAAGDRDNALRVLGKAEGAADWRYRFSQIRSVLTLGLL